jgi:hypothetical protein
MRTAERNNYKRAWFRRRARSLNKRRFIFVDESAINTAMTEHSIVPALYNTFPF